MCPTSCPRLLDLTPFRINSQLLGHWCSVARLVLTVYFTYLHQSYHWSQTNAAFFQPSTIVKCALIQIQVSFISDLFLFKKKTHCNWKSIYQSQMNSCCLFQYSLSSQIYIPDVVFSDKAMLRQIYTAFSDEIVMSFTGSSHSFQIYVLSWFLLCQMCSSDKIAATDTFFRYITLWTRYMLISSKCP